MTVRRWLVLLVAVALLAGCSGDPKPRFSPTSSAPTSSSPSPDKSKPWEEKSKAGAVAFAKHWVDLFNTVQMSGETSSLQRASASACRTCSNITKAATQLYESGGRVEGGGWQVTSAVPAPEKGVPEGQALISLTIQRPAQTWHYGDGSSKQYRASLQTFTARVEWDGSQWRMYELVIAA